MAKKILFINQEILPYVPETELSQFGIDMPSEMLEAGYEIRTFMPKWASINERRGQLHEVIRLSGLNIIINDTDHPLIIKVASIPQKRIQVYFIDNEDYFSKKHGTLKEELKNEYNTNGEKAIFFARGILETVKKLRWTPDIIHCQGWISSVVPFYVRTAYCDEPQFKNTKIVTSLFKELPSQEFGNNFKKTLKIKGVNSKSLNCYKDKFDVLELNKLAIDFSDTIIKTSANVDSELIKYAQIANKNIIDQPVNKEDIKETYTDLYKKLIV